MTDTTSEASDPPAARRHAVLLPATAACLLAVVPLAPALAQEQTDPKGLAVVVIAVADYPEGTRWHNEALKQVTLATAEELRGFFENDLGAEVRILSKREETTSDYLRQFLRTEFPALARRRVTLLFVMGHGERITHESRLYKRDLMLVTSDADQERPAARSLLVGGELLPALSALPDGSVILTFLDQCYSGAAASPAIDVMPGLHEIAGIKALVMASSSPDQPSYFVQFTKSLLKFWRSPEHSCTEFRAAPQLLEKLMADSSGMPDTQTPQIILAFRGRLCLDSFTPHNTLLLIHNKTSDDLQAEIVPQGSGEESPAIALEPSDVTPVRLTRGVYSVKVRRGAAQPVYNTDIDLTRNATVWAEVPPSRASRASAAELRAMGLASVKAATFARLAGLGSSAVNAIRKQAVTALALGGEPNAAKPLLAAIANDGGIDSAWDEAAKLAYLPTAEVMRAAPGDARAQAELADQLKAMGDFANAAELHASAARATSSARWTRAAYLDFAASGQAKRARTWRKAQSPRKDAIECDTTCRLAEAKAAANPSPDTVDLFSALAAQKLAIDWRATRAMSGAGDSAFALH